MAYIFVSHIGDVDHRLDLKDVIYVKANGDYCSLVTKLKTYTYHCTMKNMEDILGDKFLRISRGFIVNLSCIDEISDHTVYIHGIEIPLNTFTRKSRINYKDNLYKKLGLGNRSPIYTKAK